VSGGAQRQIGPGEPFVGVGAKFLGDRGLVGTVANQRGQFRQRRDDLTSAGVVRGEERFIAGQVIAARAGLNVKQQLLDFQAFGDHAVGMSAPGHRPKQEPDHGEQHHRANPQGHQGNDGHALQRAVEGVVNRVAEPAHAGSLGMNNE